MTRLTQQDVEERMYKGGIARAERMMATAEEKGEASRNPYGQAIMQQFVIPLSLAIKESWEGRTAGRYQAHAALLQPLDPEATAFLAVRSVLNSLLGGIPDEPTLRRVSGAAGTLVHQELVLAQIASLNPELYFTLANDFNRKRSKNLRHQLKVFKMQAEKAGLEWAEWGVGARDQVGAFLVEQLARLGMVELDEPATREDGKRRAGKLAPMMVRLAPPVRELIDQIKGYVAITSPVYGPCVEQPHDWTSMVGGGYHTDAMRRTHPFLVKAHAVARDLLMKHEDWDTVTTAVNAMQRTSWRVNTKVLDVAREVSKYRDAGEIVGQQEQPRPAAPAWLVSEASKELRSAKQEAEFKLWKRQMAEWYTQRKLRGVQYGRFYSAMRAADMFRDEPELFFVYFLDSRGRAYPLTYGLSPQGSDLQKALITFATGKPLLDQDAKDWFMIHGANKWGFDKARLQERVQWVKERHQLIMDIAYDPHNHDAWTTCDNPLQFLAWAFEYAEWQRLGDNFESRIPVSLDGSCNGLQNFSAMLRDAVGGKATNLTANVEREDIYEEVAAATTKLMQESPDAVDPASLVGRWLALGIKRGVVKRTVMTTPYGITKRSAVTYVVEDYLKKGEAPCFTKEEYYPAAQCLMGFAWEALGSVVVKSREAMDWLKLCAKAIMKERAEASDGVISWVTPSGFLATQAYYEILEHRITTRVHGSMKLKVVSEDEDPSLSRHGQGLAPNFVHSADAAHLHLTAAAAPRCGIDHLALIHDDYGTHAADTQKLYTLLRVVFVEMYQKHDPIEDFRARYPEVPEPPDKGNLDITEVLHSEHFFS